MQFYRKNKEDVFGCSLCDVTCLTESAYTEHCETYVHKREVEMRINKTQIDASYTHLPLVFISVFEHHSNILPWREAGARVEVIPMKDDGDFNYEYLEDQLKLHRDDDCVKIGSFSAGSNVTGTLFDTDRIAIMCHENNFLALFDYAAVAPYIENSVSGPSVNRSHFNYSIKGKEKLAYKDAVFISPHKFTGGPGTSGILLAKKMIITSASPYRPAGGTVLFVTEQDHVYVDNVEEMEEGGTPGILQDIRTGLAFQLKEQLGDEMIHKLEERTVKKAMRRFSKIPNLLLLGNNYLPKVPIFSFVISTKDGKVLNP